MGSSCGILGDKKAATRTLAQEGGACLDELGPLAEKYLDGNVSAEQWGATWDCVDDTIDLFKKFVKGSDESGYNSSDVQILMQKFLFARNTVSPQLVEGALSVKASIFGGSNQYLAKTELDQFRSLVKFIKTETLILLPHLKNRKTDPSSKNLGAFAEAVSTLGDHFADYLKTDGNLRLTTAMIEQFIGELAVVSSTTDPLKAKQWARFLLEVKVLLVHGDEGGISASDWNNILRFGFKFGGSFIAYLDYNDGDSTFQIEMIDRIHSVLKTSLSAWGNTLPYSQMNKIIENVPSNLLPRLANDFKIGLASLISPRKETQSDGKIITFRPALSRLFQAKGDSGIEAGSIQYLFDNVKRGFRANDHIHSIFSGAKEDLTPDKFETRAKNYSTSLSTTSKQEVDRLITIAHRYPGLHPSSTPEILFDKLDKHSINNLNRMSWYELGSEMLLAGYGTGSNQYGKAGTRDDLDKLILDLKPFLYSVGMVHPLKVGVGAKRFREANLFMPNGDGNDLMDLTETTVYMAFLFSSGNLSSRIVKASMKGETPCPMLGWNIPLKTEVYDIHCVRERFLTNFNDLMINLPRLRDDYAAADQAGKDGLYRALEAASKNSGYNDDPISDFDISSYAGLPHFAESMITKFDKNGDGALDRDEVLTYAFPIFKRELSLISKIKIDFVNKAVLLYLMQYGKRPEIKDLLKWAIGFEFLKKFQARRIRVYQIFEALSPPIPADPISQTPPTDIILPESTPLGFISHSLLKGLIPPSTRIITAELQQPSSPAPTSFNLDKIDPVQLEGYSKSGPVIDPTSPYQEALEVLPQDL